MLIDLAAQVAPDLEVVFLDTQYHFAETLWYVETIRRRYDLRLRIIEPDVTPDDRWLDDPDACCAARKVVPMARALAGKEAVDDRAAPRRGPDPRVDARSSATTSGAGW